MKVDKQSPLYTEKKVNTKYLIGVISSIMAYCKAIRQFDFCGYMVYLYTTLELPRKFEIHKECKQYENFIFLIPSEIGPESPFQ